MVIDVCDHLSLGKVADCQYIGFLFYRETAREIKRLDSILRSHIYASFNEQLSGLTVIRAFGKQHTYERHVQNALYAENVSHLALQTSHTHSQASSYFEC